MQTVFVIGGIGSGKSTVTKMFAKLGAHRIDLDAIGHEALRDDQVKGRLIASFGAHIRGAAGEIDRPTLAKLAFKDRESLRLLNEATSCKIIELLENELDEMRVGSVFSAEAGTRTVAEMDIEAGTEAVAVVEASAFDGSEEFADIPDAVIAVCAKTGLRIERAVAAGFGKEDVLRRNALQAGDEERRSWADFIVENNGDLDALEKQVLRIWEQLASSKRVGK